MIWKMEKWIFSYPFKTKMWEFSHSVEVKSQPETVWKIWADVETWSQWDPDVLWSKLNGGFQEGSKGKLKPVTGPATTFAITKLILHQKFVSQSKVLFTRFIFSHEIKENDRCLTVTHKIKVSGLLSFLFKKIFGPQLAKGQPIAMMNLKQLAEGQESK